MHEVLQAAQAKKNLVEAGITHILCVAATLDLLFPESFTYKKIKVLDNADTDLSQYFADCFAFIDETLLSGGKVFVHCVAGRSRSATIVIAWLMKSRGFSLDSAMEHCQAVRPNVQPNFGFMAQLRRFEKELLTPSEDPENCVTVAHHDGSNETNNTTSTLAVDNTL